MRRDTRTWHSWPGHNSAGKTRYAVVNRWAPWWLSVAEFGHGHGNKPTFTPDEWRALPETVQPLFAHLVNTERQARRGEDPVSWRMATPEEEAFNLIQPPNQERARRINEYIRSRQFAEDANAHVRVELRGDLVAAL